MDERFSRWQCALEIDRNNHATSVVAVDHEEAFDRALDPHLGVAVADDEQLRTKTRKKFSHMLWILKATPDSAPSCSGWRSVIIGRQVAIERALIKVLSSWNGMGAPESILRAEHEWHSEYELSYRGCDFFSAVTKDIVKPIVEHRHLVATTFADTHSMTLRQLVVGKQWMNLERKSLDEFGDDREIAIGNIHSVNKILAVNQFVKHDMVIRG